jgi:hypothetical protein
MLKKEKKRKKESVEHRTYANPPPKAHTQSPTAAGMRKYKRSQQ